MKITQKDRSITVVFDFDIAGEEDRFNELFDFTKVHNIFCSRNETPSWDDENHCIYQMHVALYSTMANGDDIEAGDQVGKDLHQLVGILERASKASELSICPQFRFRAKDLRAFDDTLINLVNNLGYAVPLSPIGMGWTTNGSYQVYEVTLSRDEMMEVKLKFENVKDIFEDHSDE